LFIGLGFRGLKMRVVEPRPSLVGLADAIHQGELGVNNLGGFACLDGFKDYCVDFAVLGELAEQHSEVLTATYDC